MPMELFEWSMGAQFLKSEKKNSMNYGQLFSDI